MLRDLIEEASRKDLVPKPASLWWTSTYDPEERCDISIYTPTGKLMHLFFFVWGVNMHMQLQFLAPVELFF